jgi:transcriptional regulator with GAF, ATPase, and Fis domain
MATFFPSDAFPTGDESSPPPRSTCARASWRTRRRLISAALAETGGNQRRAARLLGILPTTLHEKLKRLGMRTPRADASPEDTERDLLLG